MNTVKFVFPEGLGDDVLGHAPLQILDKDLAPAMQTRLGATVELAEGLYGARAVLPDGQELTAAFYVEEREHDHDPQTFTLKTTLLAAPAVTAPLEDPAAEAAPRPNAGARVGAWLRGLQIGRHDAPVAAEARGLEPGAVTIRQVCGNQLMSDLSTVGEPVRLRLGDEGAIVPGPGLQTLVLDGRWQVTAPAAPNTKRRFKIVARRGGRLLPHFHFDDPDLELLLRYAGAGMVSREADVVSQSDALLARRAFEYNDEDRPIASAVGAYVQLRTGQLDDLEWIDNLAAKFPWFADPLAISAEYHARRGDHDQARKRLMGITERGLPFFLWGLSYAINRLQQYDNIARATADRSEDHEALGLLLEKLSQIAARTDFSRPILTYDMSDPA